MKKLFLLAVVLMLTVCAVFPVTTSYASEVVYVLDSCDNASNCVTSKISDTSNYVEGMGSMYSNNEAGRVTFEFKNVNYDALPRYSSAYLEFYYYVEDVTNIKAGQIELTSSGYEDVNELNYDIGVNSGFKNGWNFVSIKLSSMNNNGFSYNKLFGFRIFMLPAKTDSFFVCRVDNIVLSSVSHKEEVERNGIVSYTKQKMVLQQKISDDAV